jgi:hypothetical protein
MGGEREVNVASSVKNSAQSPIEIGNVRIHESGGKVHFHSDAKNLKVAVPSAKWFEAWTKLSQSPNKWSYVDHENKTAISVETRFAGFTGSLVDAEIILTPITIGDTFVKLQKFTVK